MPETKSHSWDPMQKKKKALSSSSALTALISKVSEAVQESAWFRNAGA